MPWYDLAPIDYARGLEYGAARSEESANVKLKEGKPWSAREAEHMTRQARRLRAMALLCVRSTAVRAGDIDFRRLHDPTCPRDVEDQICSEIEAGR